MRYFFIILFALISTVCAAQDLPLNLLKLPPGFTISIFATPVPDARSLALGANNTVFVGSRPAGKVYAIVPDAQSPHGTRVLTIASGLNMPNGVAFKDGALYVAEIQRVLRFDDIENHLSDPPKPVVIRGDLPTESHHGWHYIGFGPDGKLYISIGMPCNICLQKDPRFGTIMRMNADGSHFEVFVKGLRNSVGFDWHPLTQHLWLTDNGRDWMGDNLPPDKLNYAPIKDLNFGFPYVDGKNLPDPIYGKLQTATTITPPTYELPAHVAPLGMKFYNGNMFPADYKNQIFIAEHGSWNRSSKVGYQVVIAKLDGNQVSSVKPFITGWLQGQMAWGRPVDALIMPDGSLLLSDDYAGVIYRITYKI